MWFLSAVWTTASAGRITLYILAYKVKNGKYPNSSDSFYYNFSELCLCCNSVGWSNVIWSTPEKRSSVFNVVQHLFIYEFCSDFWLRFSLQKTPKKHKIQLNLFYEFALILLPDDDDDLKQVHSAIKPPHREVSLQTWSGGWTEAVSSGAWPAGAASWTCSGVSWMPDSENGPHRACSPGPGLIPAPNRIM